MTDQDSRFFDDQRPLSKASKKAIARRKRKQTRRGQEPSGARFQSPREEVRQTREPIKPRNANQAKMMVALTTEDQVFAIGPAGTGKTYLAARHILRRLLDGQIDKICIARPSVAKKKHQLGFRPGKQDDKIADWLVPIMDGFKSEAGPATIEKLRKDGKIEFLAFETLRGRSLSNACIMLDEAQNCDLSDLKLFLTRTGEGSQVIVSGDVDQVDIEDSGLATVLDMIDHFRLSVGVIEFTHDDVVRSKSAREWVRAFSAVPLCKFG